MVISTAFAHDLVKRTIKPDLSEKSELKLARVGAGFAVIVAGYFGMNPPDYVAAVVAFAFGLAAASFFPVILMGIFTKRINKYGAIAGMLVGIGFTATYIIHFKIVNPELNVPENWLFEISPEGIGTIGMLLNFAVMIPISLITKPPSEKVGEMVERIRLPGD